MLTIFIRTLLIYLMLTVAMRLMGKRQIGELEVSELITTLLISELATLPIENIDIPLLHVVVPIVTLLMLEVSMSVILTRCPRMRRILEAQPSMLICGGKIRQRELLRNRLSIDELLSALRQQGVADPDEVAYAILEKNGQVSIILKEECRPLTPKDQKLSCPGEGMMHLIISDGVVHDYNMRLLGRDDAWLRACLARYAVEQEQVLYLLCNDAGRTVLTRREEG